MLEDNCFGEAGSSIVIEEFLRGEEASFIVMVADSSILPMATSQDHKARDNEDKGPNTGGMGAVSPVPFLDNLFEQKISNQIIKPTIEGLKKDKIPYKGFIFIGLIKVGDDPKVIEYNVRLGDPETEVVIPRIKNDLGELFQAVQEGTLDKIQLEIESQVAATVMAVSKGYPEAYEKGKAIKGLSKGEMIFHAGTKIIDGQVQTSGGRVLAVTSMAEEYKTALLNSYETLSKLSFEGINYRKDIGFDL